MSLGGDAVGEADIDPPPAVLQQKVVVALLESRDLDKAVPDGERVEAVALMAGVNRLAVPTGGAQQAARELELEVRRQETCCSVGLLP